MSTPVTQTNQDAYDQYLQSLGIGGKSPKKPISEMESGYEYNANTAAQSPSLTADLAIHNAYSQPLQNEASTGSLYGGTNPFEMATSMGQSMTDQAATSIANSATTDPSAGGSSGTATSSGAAGRKHDPAWMKAAKKEFGTNRQGVLDLLEKANIRNLDSAKDITTIKNWQKSITKTDQPKGTKEPSFDAPVLMQTKGQEKIDRAEKVLNNPDAAAAAREKARQRMRSGMDQRKLGQISEGFQSDSIKRKERRDAGETTKNQTRSMDRKFGKAVSRFGAEKASQMAEAYGQSRYAEGRQSSFSDQERDQATDRLGRLVRRRDEMRERAGGKNYSQITGDDRASNKQRSAAKRARHFTKMINRNIGKISRRYGAETASNIAKTAFNADYGV